MTSIKNVNQKLKGNLQQLHGKLESTAGDRLNGKIRELRGKANVFEADLKDLVENSKK